MWFRYSRVDGSNGLEVVDIVWRGDGYYLHDEASSVGNCILPARQAHGGWEVPKGYEDE